jgi:predicted nucleic acid-binding protein
MSGFLLDTKVICELIKRRPQRQVSSWVETIDESLLYLSVLSIGEIRSGIARLPQAKQRTTLEAWLQTSLRTRFDGRILAIDDDVADRFGLLIAQAQKNKVILPLIDGLLAATALQHNLTFVTRDADHIAKIGIGVFDPWLET